MKRPLRLDFYAMNLSICIFPKVHRFLLLIACLASCLGIAHAQKRKETQNNHTSAQSPGPSVEATQQYIAELLATPEKSAARFLANVTPLRDADSKRGYTDWEEAYYKLTFKESCKASYIQKHKRYMVFNNENGWEETKTIREFQLDFSKLNLKYEYSSIGAGFDYPVFFSKKGIENIPFVFSRSYRGERRNARKDMVDIDKPDEDGSSMANSVNVPIQFLGIYEEKAKKAFEHLMNECAKRSSEPKELF